MKNEDKIVELLPDLLVKQDQIVDELKNVKGEVKEMKGDIKDMKEDIKGVKSEVIKLNLQTAENTRAIFKLADQVEQNANLEGRVAKLEKVVFK